MTESESALPPPKPPEPSPGELLIEHGCYGADDVGEIVGHDILDSGFIRLTIEHDGKRHCVGYYAEPVIDSDEMDEIDRIFPPKRPKRDRTIVLSD